MAAKSSKAEQPHATAPAGIAGAGLAMSVGSLAAQVWMNFVAEAARFAWDRLQQEIKTQQAMLSCTTLDEARTIHADFVTTAQGQYAAEARKLLDIMQQATTSGLAIASNARRYDDVPL